MRFQFLAKHFPPPNFLKPAHIGVSFSDSNIKAISLQGTRLKPELKSIIIPLSSGSVLGGKIVDTQEVVKKLTVIKEYFSSPFVFFTIPDELAYIFQTSIPVVKGENTSEAIAFTIEENVPLPLVDVIFDFEPIRIVKSENGYQSEMVVVACVKKELEKFGQAVKDGGLSLVGCIHESQAIANAVIPKNSLGIFCIVHARKDRIGVYLVKDNVVRFATLRSILEGDYLGQFLDEYQKFLEYSLKDNKNEDKTIKTVFVCGDFKYASKIVEVIAKGDSLIKNVKLANVWNNILKIEQNIPTLSYEESLNFAGPLGAVLAEVL